MPDPAAKEFHQPAVTAEVIASHGITSEEYQKIVKMLGHEPNYTELGVFSVMWSEHCSYKSSRHYLKNLPTEGPYVLQGPGENAGVVDIGNGLAVAFKMESHNHPSFIEPYQGAATGVGGILRDIFTMGARPIASLNSLRFGSVDHPRTRYLLGGVVAGIGGYGNCIGVPTVGGECYFDACYNANILVNAFTLGIVKKKQVFTGIAKGTGNPVMYVGSKTGRDGIHGATMASESFSEEKEQRRPTVQVGDPFTEKLLIEACLELMATDAIVAIQDMGAAGLTSSSFEMADKGELGLEIALDKVPMRETGMNPYELMLSESQERMLMVLKPGREDQARRIFEKWELDFAVIGHLTDTRRMVLRWHGDVVANIPIPPVVTEAPMYERPWTATPLPPAIDAASVAAPKDYAAALLQLVGSPDQCSKAWVWRQYDHLIMGNTAIRPGGDAAVVRVPDGNGKALAITSDCTPRYCQAHPETGGRQAVAEAWRNLTAVGATPLACTDNMNFGNPQKPDIMGQFAGCTMGMAEACTTLAFPIVSGNVSLYNETQGRGILPTPVIGGVGVMQDVTACVDIALREAGLALILVGETKGHLGQSIYLRDILGREDGPPPPVDLSVEKRNGDFVRAQIDARRVAACHDLSDGGLALAVAEMAMAGNTGLTVALPNDTACPAHAYMFGEDQGRYVMAVRPGDVDAVLKDAAAAGVPATRLGTSGGAALTVEGLLAISVADLRRAHESWLPAYMEARS